MSKFTFAAFNAPGDPFGGDKPETVEVSGRRSPATSFRFVEDPSFLPATAKKRLDLGRPLFDDDAKLSPEARAMKINLPKLAKDDSFLPATELPISDRGRRSGSSSQGFTFAKSDNGSEAFDAVGLGDTVPVGSFTKAAAAEFHKFARFTKVQETADGDVLVWGIATLERPDLDGEICDYDAAKGAYQAWSVASVTRTSSAGQQISLGPIRYQHSIEPAGKATKLEYNDDAKEIWLGSIPINDDIRQQLQNGFLTGYSQGGSYAWRNCADCDKSLSLQQGNNYCSNCKKNVQVVYGLKSVSEVSYVDSPCTGEGFDYVKADGTARFVKFAKRSASSSSGMKILSTETIHRDILKSIVRIGGRNRVLLTWQRKLPGRDNYLLV